MLSRMIAVSASSSRLARSSSRRRCASADSLVARSRSLSSKSACLGGRAERASRSLATIARLSSASFSSSSVGWRGVALASSSLSRMARCKASSPTELSLPLGCLVGVLVSLGLSRSRSLPTSYLVSSMSRDRSVYLRDPVERRLVVLAAEEAGSSSKTRRCTSG